MLFIYVILSFFTLLFLLIYFIVESYTFQVVHPGWLDMRMPHSDWSVELRLILALGRALRTGEMDWSEADLSVPVNDVFEGVKSLLKGNCLAAAVVSFSFFVPCCTTDDFF